MEGLESLEDKLEIVENTTSSIGWLQSLVNEVIDVKGKVDKEELDRNVSTILDPCLSLVWRCLSGLGEEGVRYLGSQEDMMG